MEDNSGGTSGLGRYGSFIGLLSYIIAVICKYLPPPAHFFPAIFTAACSAAVGFLVLKFMGWAWIKSGLAITYISIKITTSSKRIIEEGKRGFIKKLFTKTKKK